MQDIEREKEFLAYWAGDSFKSLGKTKLIIFLKTSSVVNASRESFHFRNPSNFVLYSEVWAIHSIDKFVKVAQPEEAGQKSNNLGKASISSSLGPIYSTILSGISPGCSSIFVGTGRNLWATKSLGFRSR